MTETVDVETEELLTRYHVRAGKTEFGKTSAEEAREFQDLQSRLGDLLTAPGESSEEFRLREVSSAKKIEGRRRRCPRGARPTRTRTPVERATYHAQGGGGCPTNGEPTSGFAPGWACAYPPAQEPTVYLKQLKITGIKCFDAVTLNFPADDAGSFAGWNVLLGANATGKSTLLQAMGIALVGPSAWPQLLTPKGWVRRGVKEVGTLHADIVKGNYDLADRAQKGPFKPHIAVMPDASVEYEGIPYDTPQFVLGSKDKSGILKSVYATKKRGWLACGYGPFRRLSGGGNDMLARLTNPRQWRMASLFDESVALVRCEPWLLDLHHKASDPDHGERTRYTSALDQLKAIINSLLPGRVRLDRVDSTGVYFVTGSNTPIALSELSDGYRSFLALVIDLLRHIFEEHETNAEGSGGDPWKYADGAVQVEGVVLIDEIDAHLHPTWQRRIGRMLQSVFPRMQFIVSTHSPFVAQAASDGGLFMLRAGTPGAGADLKLRPADAVEIVQPVTSVKGWRAERILTSDLFGMTETVDVDTEELLTRYHVLAGKTEFGKASAEEAREFQDLESRLGDLLTAPGESSEEFRLREEAERYIKSTLDDARRTAS